MCLKSGRLADNIAARVLKWRLRFTYKSCSRKKCKAKPVNTEMSTMSMRISTARPALSGASPNHLSMKSIRLTRLSRQASCRTPERCATSHNRRGYGVGPWSNTVLHHRLQTSVLRKWNTRNGRRAFSLAASILTALGSAALDCARLSPQKKPRRLGRRGSRRFPRWRKDRQETVMRPRITDFAVELGKQISHKQHQ